jgi:hypothetical protein
VIIALLLKENPDFVYVRSFLVQLFLIVTATGIAVSIYFNNYVSERLAKGQLLAHWEVQQNTADILKVSFVQSLVVIVGLYALFQLGAFGRNLGIVGIQSLVIGALIYMLYEPVKAINIMLLTVIRRLHIAAFPTMISVASNIVAMACAFLATWFFEHGIQIFIVLIAIVFTDELFRCLIYNWCLKSKLNRGLFHG